MKTLTYEEYLDKIYGCWLGKCVIGTLGAPYEGMKQTNSLVFSPDMIAETLPNDDLDLQVLWLSVLEEKGVNITSEDLARAFYEKNIKWPGEYAWFRKNYARGIRPPYSGEFENRFYREGMGCPIRAEIWGMILPGNPSAAAKLSEIDGTLDHKGDSVLFEKFWAAMVSAAFFESDIRKLVETGLKEIDKNGKAYSLVADAVRWCDEYDDPFIIRSNVIGKYGHCDCTNAYQNIGFTLIALLKCGKDPLAAGVLASNLGFDTDCTAGNAGALIGLIIGAKAMEKFGIRESRYKLNLRYKRRSDDVKDLAEDTAKAGVHFLNRGFYGAENTVIADGIPDGIVDCDIPAITIANEYVNPPYVAPGESAVVDFLFENNTQNAAKLSVTAVSAKDFSFALEKESIEIPPFGSERVRGVITCAAKEFLEETNEFAVKAVSQSGETFTRAFGVIGKRAAAWYGPFWENDIEIDLNADGGKNKFSYCNAFTGKDVNERVDNMRRYQLNTVTRFGKEYLSFEDLSVEDDGGKYYEFRPKRAFFKGDTFRIKDFSGFKGAAVYYVRQIYRFPEKRRVCLFVGHTCPFRLYIDGKLTLENDKSENYTPENMHYYNLFLEKGEHDFVYKLDASSGDAEFGVIINVDDETGQYPHTRCATRIIGTENI